MVFCSPELSSGVTAASKSTYCPTIICGSNAKGEALPPHFQLKTTATDVSREKISIEFIAGCHDVYGRFGHDKEKKLPVTFGLNQRAGMNAEELEKYFVGSILLLYPDIEDKPLKRVLVKVDSGPG